MYILLNASTHVSVDARMLHACVMSKTHHQLHAPRVSPCSLMPGDEIEEGRGQGRAQGRGVGKGGGLVEEGREGGGGGQHEGGWAWG